MIDLHLHLLPGVDDGPDSVSITREMLASMSTMGYKRLVATPHLMQPLTFEYHQAVLSALEQVRSEAAAFWIHVDLGYEHMLDPALPRRLTNGEPTTIAGTSAVLVELPFVSWPNYTEATLFELRTAGFRPLLAHPERYSEASLRPELVMAVAEQGAVLQLSIGSFDGVYGKSAQKLARRFLADALAQDLPIILATDAHSAGQRLSRVPAGLDWIRGNVPGGGHVVEWGCSVNPGRILLDQPAIGFTSWLQHQLPEEVATGWRQPVEEPVRTDRLRSRFLPPWRS